MIMKLLRLLIFGIFAGFISFGIVLQLSSVREGAKKYLIEQISASTEYNVEIEEIKLYPSFEATARNIILKQDGEQIAVIDHVHVGIYPLALLYHKIHLHTLHLEKINILKLPASNTSSSNAIPPVNCKIDNLKVEELKWNLPNVPSPDFPVSFKGSLFIDTNVPQISVNFNTSSPKAPDQWFQGNFVFKDNSGSLMLEQGRDHRVALEFDYQRENGIRISQLEAAWECFSVKGTLTVDPEGIIKESQFFLSATDLNQLIAVEGSLTGEAVIKGSILSPKLDLFLHSNSLKAFGHQIEQLNLRLSTMEKGILALSFQKYGEPYHFSSALTLDKNHSWVPSQIDLRLPVEEVSRLMDWDAADIGGTILIHVKLRDRKLKLQGELLDGVYEGFDLGSRFTGIHALVEGDLQTLHLKELTASDTEQGTYLCRGKLELNPKADFPFSIDIRLDNTHPFQSDIFSASLSGDLILSGTTSKGLLKGNLNAYSSRFRIPENMSDSANVIPINYINQPENETPPTLQVSKKASWPMDLNVNVAIPDQLKIKGRGLNSLWKGEVNLSGTLETLKAKGELKLIDGNYVLRGKTFEFRDGSINFNGAPQKNTTLYLTAEMDLPDLTIQVDLKGEILNPSITLRSTPSMSQRAILSWLLFNKGISEINPMEETQLSRSLRSLMDNVDAQPDLLTRVGDVLGLDQVEIGSSPSGEAGDFTVKVGKYLTESTYLSISRTISSGSSSEKDRSCIGIETRLGRHFRFRAEGDTETNGRLNLLWKNDY
jgi:autotransporter translocation and assembly factor TamB